MKRSRVRIGRGQARSAPPSASGRIGRTKESANSIAPISTEPIRLLPMVSTTGASSSRLTSSSAKSMALTRASATAKPTSIRAPRSETLTSRHCGLLGARMARDSRQAK